MNKPTQTTDNFSFKKLPLVLKPDSIAGVSSLAVSSKGSLVTGLLEGTINIHYQHSPQVTKKIMAHNSAVISLACGKNEKLLYSLSWDNSLKIWDFSSGNLIIEVILSEGIPDKAVISNNEKYIAVHFLDGLIAIYDTATGLFVNSFKINNSKQSFVFSKNSKHIVSFSGRYIERWSIETGVRISSAQHLNLAAMPVRLYNSGKNVVSESKNGIYIWEAATEKILHTIKHAYTTLKEILISPNNSYLVGGSPILVMIS